MSIQTKTTIQTNFDLKNAVVSLIPAAKRSIANLTTVQLEAMRTRGRLVPASKYGLEAICGASCETGAQ